jgi:alkyldihydroxyacetonephosphate synthase
MSERRRKFWGWGYEGDGISDGEADEVASRLAAAFGADAVRDRQPPCVEDLDLRAPRVAAPSALTELFTDAPHERASHAYGKSYRDLARAWRAEVPNPPDLVALPASEDDVVRILEWAAGERVAVVPYGGGSSVVGGVEPEVGDEYRGAVSLDLRRLDRVVEVDTESRAALIEAGVYGPQLEEQLRPHELTLRHFPQSFEFSSLGGWIATRSGGHYATLYTHIDEFVESLRVVTPRGVLESRRLPASGAGPSPERLFCGSEGTLGVITQAWMRLQDRPRARAGATVAFPDFLAGARAARAVAQAGLHPANCRLLDPVEAFLAGAGDGSTALLIVAFESPEHDVAPWLDVALDLCHEQGGIVEPPRARNGASNDGASAWRRTFLRMPYVYERVVGLGMLNGTFETAITWNRFADFHEGVSNELSKRANEICGSAIVSVRFTYVYPDGPAPYYTVTAPARDGSELAQWDELKAAVSDAIVGLGGTITHHHAVGREHRPWYEQEAAPLFQEALRGAKRELDPAGILNPGVLVDP